MEVKYGEGATEFGPGVSIEMTGDEVATAIDAYLVAHSVHVNGPRTVTVNGALCRAGRVYVDPIGFVIADGERFCGRGPERIGTSIESAIQNVVDAVHHSISNASNGVAVFEAGELETALREFAAEILRGAGVVVKDAPLVRAE